MNNQNSFIAYTASAGSGKTYTIVQKILLICLEKPFQHEQIKYVLALTFTNKAANEMKERIITWLEDFTSSNFRESRELNDILTILQKKNPSLTIEELKERCQNLLDYIIHHYSALNIGTIDKFNSTLIRSFSFELGLPGQFNLELKNDALIEQAVDQFIEKVGQDETATKAVLQYHKENLDNEQKVNIEKTILDAAKKFISDKNYEHLIENSGLSWEAFSKIRQQISNLKKSYEDQALNICTESLNLINLKGISTKDFSGGDSYGLGVWFKKNMNNIIQNGLSSITISGSEDNYHKISTSKNQAIYFAVESIISTLIENRREVIRLYSKDLKLEKISKNLLPLKVNKEIEEILETILFENDLVLLSKFNIMIHEHLRSEPSEFIYEKVGTKYRHYFIDEFQDTSLLQWQNLLPLKDHATSTTGHSFTIVGDPKQSIYQFRGGESSLMPSVLRGDYNTTSPIAVVPMERNYRSGYRIVEFNHALFAYLAEELNPSDRKLFSPEKAPEAMKKFPGRVRVNLFEGELKEPDFVEQAAYKMKEDIQDALNQGFQFKDIHILCRRNKDIAYYSQLLGSCKVVYNGQEEFIPTMSDTGLSLNSSLTLRAFIHLMEWEISGNNFTSLVKGLYLLEKIGRISIKDFSNEVSELLETKNHEIIKKQLEERFNLSYLSDQLSGFNLYYFVESCLKSISVQGKEEDYIMEFQELVYEFSQGSNKTIKDLLDLWEEESSKIAIKANEKKDAVRLLTVHKSKGLQFPIVMFPISKSSETSKTKEEKWLKTSEFNQLKSVHATPFTTTNISDETLGIMDSSIREFNEEYNYNKAFEKLCIQYVALTRAISGMYLYLQDPSTAKEQTKRSIYSFVVAESENQASFEYFPSDLSSFQNNENKSDPKSHQNMEISFHSGSSLSETTIKISTPSKSYQETKEKVRLGIFVHEILEKIKSQKEISKVLEHYLLEGIVTVEEAEQIKNRILKVITDPRYSAYFKEDLEIATEKEFMITNEGKTIRYRIDRLIHTPQGVIIIDFKTGGVYEKYEKQIDQYKTALSSIGYTIAGSEIIYV